MHCCLQALLVQSLDCWLLDQWNLVEGNFVVQDQPRDQDCSVCGQLQLAQVPDVAEVLTDGLGAVPGRVVAQDASEYQRGPLLA